MHKIELKLLRSHNSLVNKSKKQEVKTSRRLWIKTISKFHYRESCLAVVTDVLSFCDRSLLCSERWNVLRIIMHQKASFEPRKFSICQQGDGRRVQTRTRECYPIPWYFPNCFLCSLSMRTRKVCRLRFSYFNYGKIFCKRSCDHYATSGRSFTTHSWLSRIL